MHQLNTSLIDLPTCPINGEDGEYGSPVFKWKKDNEPKQLEVENIREEEIEEKNEYLVTGSSYDPDIDCKVRR